MLGAFRSSLSHAAASRSFSTSARRMDMAKIVLIGNLAKTPELRLTKNEKEFVTYTVVTNSYPPPPVDASGERRPGTATFHRVLSFHEGPNRFLQTLKKGSKVYVEANFELREPEAGADPTTPQGQRQIFLRHEGLRVISSPRTPTEESEHEDA